MADTIRTIGFVGTGIMGAPIAGHLMDAGYDLVVYNRTQSKADGLVARGAKRAMTPAEAAREADVVFTMVGYPTDVEDVYLGSDGILDAAPKGAWLIDLTTSSPTLAKEIHDAAEVVGKHAFDCPVTGGQAGAEAGTLTLIVGATEAEIAPVRPVLEAFSSKIFCFGGAGKGQAAKLCNQVSLASCMVGMADAIGLAEVSGLDVDEMLDMVGAGMGGSRAMHDLAPKSVAHDWAPGFLVEHLRKDLGLAIDEADENGLTLPGAETAYSLYDAICDLGGSRLGTQALTLLYEEPEVGEAAGLDWSALDDEDDSADADDAADAAGDADDAGSDKA
jgi:3-hydroxyisobutyrate dehydrogenase